MLSDLFGKAHLCLGPSFGGFFSAWFSFLEVPFLLRRRSGRSESGDLSGLPGSFEVVTNGIRIGNRGDDLDCGRQMDSLVDPTEQLQHAVILQ